MSKLLDSVSKEIRKKNYSLRTDKTYRKWIKEFILFNNKKHPANLGAEEIQKYLSHLAVDRNLSPSSQHVALNSLVFLYKNVLKLDIGDFSKFVKSKKTRKIPVVFSKSEVKLVLNNLENTNKIICGLLYGSGLRLMEALRLRIKDIYLTFSKTVTIFAPFRNCSRAQVIEYYNDIHTPNQQRCFRSSQSAGLILNFPNPDKSMPKRGRSILK